MTSLLRCFLPYLLTKRSLSQIMYPPMVLCLALVMATACSHIASFPVPQDPAAERIIDTIKQTNIDLVQFKCIGKITVSEPKQPVQSYRSAIAGQMNDHLRIDLFAPFGGAAGSVASDGKYLYLAMHASRKYYKKRFSNGSLYRFVKIDITVEDLLELLVGRIPMDDERLAQSLPVTDADYPGACLVDRRGQIRQKIFLDTDGRPFQALWFDQDGKQMLSLKISGRQTIDGFILPKRIQLLAGSGQTVSIVIDRYHANAALEKALFVLPPISS